MRRPSGHFAVGPAALLLALLITMLAVGVRLGPLRGQSLWVDEIFSLAMATGHSLEHAASVAEPALGDYVELPAPVPASELQRYLEHSEPPAGLRRLTRALLMSDLSPPLYYLLLAGWTRLVGTSDLTLRSFSVLCSVASLPLLAWLAWAVAGRRAVVPALILFALSPQAIYYGTEGRMYALLMLVSLAHGALTLALGRSREDREPSRWLPWLWSLSGAAALLTHYFFLFVWLAMLAWLAFHWRPRRVRRMLFFTSLTVLLVLPWYRWVPSTYSSWRITGGWLDGYPDLPAAILAPLRLLWSYFAAEGVGLWLGRVLVGVFLVLAGLLVARIRRRGFEPGIQLLALWLASSLSGLMALDLVRETYTSLVSRYALAGLPAAVLLAAAAAAGVSARLRAALLLAIAVCWAGPAVEIGTMSSRGGRPLTFLAELADRWAEPDDVVLIQSVPSGILGVSRYLEAPTLVAGWVEQLGVRSAPEDLQRLLRGRRRVVLVEIHRVGAARTPALWLDRHAKLEREWSIHGAKVRAYRPASGEVFGADGSSGSPDPDGEELPDRKAQGEALQRPQAADAIESRRSAASTMLGQAQQHGAQREADPIRLPPRQVQSGLGEEGLHRAGREVPEVLAQQENPEPSHQAGRQALDVGDVDRQTAARPQPAHRSPEGQAGGDHVLEDVPQSDHVERRGRILGALEQADLDRLGAEPLGRTLGGPVRRLETADVPPRVTRHRREDPGGASDVQQPAGRADRTVQKTELPRGGLPPVGALTLVERVDEPAVDHFDRAPRVLRVRAHETALRAAHDPAVHRPLPRGGERSLRRDPSRVERRGEELDLVRRAAQIADAVHHFPLGHARRPVVAAARSGPRR